MSGKFIMYIFHVFSYITGVFILVFYAAILFRFQGDLDTYSTCTLSFVFFIHFISNYLFSFGTLN